MNADGDGSNWASCHGEKFHQHQEVSKTNAKDTKLRYNSLAKQMSDRHYEDQVASVATSYQRM